MMFCKMKKEEKTNRCARKYANSYNDSHCHFFKKMNFLKNADLRLTFIWSSPSLWLKVRSNIWYREGLMTFQTKVSLKFTFIQDYELNFCEAN